MNAWLVRQSHTRSAVQEGKTPLHLAAGKTIMRGNAVTDSMRMEMARLLLAQEGVDLNAKDKRGAAPLHLAAEQGCAELVKMLLSDGDPGMKDVTATPFGSPDEVPRARAWKGRGWGSFHSGKCLRWSKHRHFPE